MFCRVVKVHLVSSLVMLALFRLSDAMVCTTRS